MGNEDGSVFKANKGLDILNRTETVEVSYDNLY
jgi:hypothetical protein